MTTYKIVRMFKKTGVQPIVIKTGLTLEEVHGHCNNPETSAETCTSSEGLECTATFGSWFDVYDEEDG